MKSLRFPAARAALLSWLTVTSLSAQHVCSNHRTQPQNDSRINRLIAQMTVEERIAQLQDRAPAIARLGLPAYNWWNEGLHGLARNGYATVFPQAIGLAATWDSGLLQQVGDTASTEARAKFNQASSHGLGDSPRYGGLTIWSPNINIFRDPRWGRGQETYGEDPFLTATLGTAFVKGIQGPDPFYRKADATPKHFAAHSGPEQGRDSFNAQVSAHDLADTYLPAFHALVADGHADALMCSYNAIDGTPSCANRLLQQTVRNRWRFGGYIVSDCDAVGNLTGYQHYTADVEHGATAALNAGVDLDCGNSFRPLAAALDRRLTTPANIDAALHRLLSARLRLGLLDTAGCSPYDGIPPSANDTPEHRALALRAATESIVLLKNDGILPLQPGTRIAVIGANADSLKILQANYHGTASAPVTLLEGLREAFPGALYAQGSQLIAGLPTPVPRTALRTTPTGSAEGLHAEYFDNPSLTGTPAIVTTIPRIDLDLDRVTPDARLSATHYSARWTGFLLPPAAGDYPLHVAIERCWDCTAHDRFRLYVDGALAIDGAGAGSSEPVKFLLHAADNSPHSIRLELEHTGADEGIALEWEPPPAALLDEATRAARDAGVIVLFAGLSPDLEGEALHIDLPGFAGGDRTSLDLPQAQQALLERLRQLHKPIVIVLNSGSALSLDPAASGVSALLEAWYPGEEGGHALAAILTGQSSPSGRLPVTFYRSAADLPAFSDYSMERRTYRYFSAPVLFPFGFGLGYSRFEYGPVHLSKSSLAAGESVTAKITLRNAGSRAAAEVAELYIQPPQLPGAPRLALAGWQRVTLAPHQTRTLIFDLPPPRFSTVDPAGHRAVRPGTYRIFIDGTQPGTQPGSAALHVTGHAPVD